MPTSEQKQKFPNVIFIPLLDKWATNPPELVMLNIMNTVIHNIEDSWVIILVDDCNTLTPENREQRKKMILSKIPPYFYERLKNNLEIKTVDEMFADQIRALEHKKQEIEHELQDQKLVLSILQSLPPHEAVSYLNTKIQESEMEGALHPTLTDYTAKQPKIAEAAIKWLADERKVFSTTTRKVIMKNIDHKNKPSCSYIHGMLYKLHDIIYLIIQDNHGWPERVTFCDTSAMILENTALIAKDCDLSIHVGLFEMYRDGDEIIVINLASNALTSHKIQGMQFDVFTKSQHDIFKILFRESYRISLQQWLKEQNNPAPLLFTPGCYNLIPYLYPERYQAISTATTCILYIKHNDRNSEDVHRYIARESRVKYIKETFLKYPQQQEDDKYKNDPKVYETITWLIEQTSPHTAYIANDNDICRLPICDNVFMISGIGAREHYDRIHYFLNDSKIQKATEKWQQGDRSEKTATLVYTFIRAHNIVGDIVHNILIPHIDDSRTAKIIKEHVPHELKNPEFTCYICTLPGQVNDCVILDIYNKYTEMRQTAATTAGLLSTSMSEHLSTHTKDPATDLNETAAVAARQAINISAKDQPAPYQTMNMIEQTQVITGQTCVIS